MQAQLAFAWTARACYSGLVFKIDYYKAYDYLNHDFLSALIHKVGLGHKFAHLVNMVYCDAPTHIVINGIASRPFTVARGVRQGCPLAPLLYALSTRPLMDLLQSKYHSGALWRWSMPILASPTFLLFVDDLVVFTTIEQDQWGVVR